MGKLMNQNQRDLTKVVNLVKIQSSSVLPTLIRPKVIIKKTYSLKIRQKDTQTFHNMSNSN